MWVFLTVVLLAIVLGWVGFAALNQGQWVDQINLGYLTLSHQPLSLVLLETFVLGFAICFLLAMVHEVGLRFRLNRLRRQNTALQQELVTLRNLPFEELDQLSLDEPTKPSPEPEIAPASPTKPARDVEAEWE